MAYELVATTDYVRTHEVFLIQVDLSGYLLEYYNHRQTHAPDTSRQHDEELKTLISCFAIHLAARTTLETHAWTLQVVAEPPYSLFVTGSTSEIDKDGVAKGFLVGNVLTDSIRHSDTSGVHAQCTARGESFKSYVQCDSSDVVEMVEAFYRRSEQRPMRIYVSPDSDTAVGIAALPGYDPEWFDEIEIDKLPGAADLSLARMRTSHFSFACDCSPEKLRPFFQTLAPEQLDEIYGTDEELVIRCPRCGKRFWISRSTIPAAGRFDS